MRIFSAPYIITHWLKQAAIRQLYSLTPSIPFAGTKKGLKYTHRSNFIHKEEKISFGLEAK
jgi:hypothetical protein